MAVSDNLGLYLPTREDYVSVKRDISDNFEEVDDFAGGVMNGLAIVADGDTHIAIASGQYVYIRNNPNGVSEGMYTANSAISANASIYPANVTSVSGGISNALNSKLTTESITLTNTQSVYSYSFIKKDNQRFLYMELLNWSTTDGAVVGVIPSGDRPTTRRLVMSPATDANLASTSGMVAVTVGANGNIEVKSIGTGSSRFVAFSITWNV